MVTVDWERVIMEASDKDELNEDFRLALYRVTYHRGGIEEARRRLATIDILPNEEKETVKGAWYGWKRNPTAEGYLRFLEKTVRVIERRYDDVNVKLSEIPIRKTVAVY